MNENRNEQNTGTKTIKKIGKATYEVVVHFNENEEAESLLDIDKMLDVLHFVLTGVSSYEPIKDSPFSEAVLGVSPIEGVEEYIAYTEKSRIKDIVNFLDTFDMEKALKEFSMEECKEAVT